MSPATSRSACASASTRSGRVVGRAPGLLGLAGDVDLDQHPAPGASAREHGAERGAVDRVPAASPTGRARAPCCAGARRGSASAGRQADLRDDRGRLREQLLGPVLAEVADAGAHAPRRRGRQARSSSRRRGAPSAGSRSAARRGHGDSVAHLGDTLRRSSARSPVRSHRSSDGDERLAPGRRRRAGARSGRAEAKVQTSSSCDVLDAGASRARSAPPRGDRAPGVPGACVPRPPVRSARRPARDRRGRTRTRRRACTARARRGSARFPRHADVRPRPRPRPPADRSSRRAPPRPRRRSRARSARSRP